MVTMPKNVVPRRVDAHERSGGGYTIMPDANKPRQLDRHLMREVHANWKIICQCNATLLLSTMSITKVAYEVDHWHGHEQHRKWIYHAQNLHLRGQMPPVKEESE